MGSRLRVVQGGAVVQQPLASDPWEFQAECVDAFVTSWRARGFSPVTIDNGTGLLERTLRALGRPAWEVTPDDIDKLVGDLAVAGPATATRRERGSGRNAGGELARHRTGRQHGRGHGRIGIQQGSR